MSSVLFMERSTAIHGQMEKLETTSFHALILGDIRQAIRDGRADKYEYLHKCVLEAGKQFDVSAPEKDHLLRTLSILRIKDEEERLALMWELTPDLLSPYEHKQAMLGHEFRTANGRGRICFFLQVNTKTLCAECMKSSQEGCTEICPARDGKSAQEAERKELIAA